MTIHEMNVGVRSDEDILEDLHDLARSYDPLKMSRGYFRYSVVNGVVQLQGHIKSALARRFLNDRIPDIEGVVAVDDSQLYDDDALAVEIGKLLPTGVRVRLSHGAAVLTGVLPGEVSAEELIGSVAELPGVRTVTTGFMR
jgi:osmotically-inducible protein OsmY